MTAYPGQIRPVVRRPMGLPITTECDTAWIQTRDCSDASRTEIQCLSPLHHSGVFLSNYLVTDCLFPFMNVLFNVFLGAFLSKAVLQ